MLVRFVCFAHFAYDQPILLELAGAFCPQSCKNTQQAIGLVMNELKGNHLDPETVKSVVDNLRKK